MDLDLSNLSWEQKALIGVGVVVLIILIYAYVPWGGSGSGTIDNNTTTSVVDNAPAQYNSQGYAPVNQETQNSTNESGSNKHLDTNANTDNANNDSSDNQEKTKQITTLQAKDIAAQEGLDVGSPRSGTFKQGNKNVPVWIVPLSKNNVVVREVYIDKNTGEILATQELNNEPRASENNKIDTTTN